MEAGRHPASEDFARKADSVLSAGGALWQAWRADVPLRAAGAGASDADGLVLEEDHARLEYDGTVYRPMQRRRLFNGGAEPVTRYLVRISVDRYPGRPDRSNALYRARPLTWDELALTAFCDGEPMGWCPKQDRDSFKEACPSTPVSTRPSSTATRSTTGGGARGSNARSPADPAPVGRAGTAGLDPVVWGTETSTTAEAVPLRTPITRTEDGDRLVFSWATQDPPMGARYRLEWRFRARDDDIEQHRPELRTASDRTRVAGIVQRGEPILATTARPFDLPTEAGEAGDVVDQLFAAMQRVREHHVFGKGMGLAAPQVGIDRAAAVIAPPDPDAEPLVLLNPRVISASAETDEQYEGRLSFFDVRGLVPRPLRLEVVTVRSRNVCSLVRTTVVGSSGWRC